MVKLSSVFTPIAAQGLNSRELLRCESLAPPGNEGRITQRWDKDVGPPRLLADGKVLATERQE